jgi:UDP-N-acetylglucosamine 2-epimerase (non-hydrolysing)
MRILNVVGARPNFVKIAPLMAEYRKHPGIEPLLVHTGQHYDQRLSRFFFRDLGLPEPDVNLEVGSASHAMQTAEIMKAIEPVILKHTPDAVLVVGDVNSTIACALVAVKLGVKLVHVEAGLRSFNRSMPEEINRILTDAISDLLFCTEQSGVDNLTREGIPAEKIFLVGNVMIDTLMRHRERAARSDILDRLGLNGDRFAVLTLHRPSNVDDLETLSRILEALEMIQRDMLIVFPVHPRTKKILSSLIPCKRLEQMPHLRAIDPLGYLDFLKLMTSARLVLTDSGGIQEETTCLGVPCLTLREESERPITMECGSNHIVGTDSAGIIEGYQRVLSKLKDGFQVPPLWDGHAAERIVEILRERL